MTFSDHPWCNKTTTKIAAPNGPLRSMKAVFSHLPTGLMTVADSTPASEAETNMFDVDHLPLEWSQTWGSVDYEVIVEVRPYTTEMTQVA